MLCETTKKLANELKKIEKNIFYAILTNEKLRKWVEIIHKKNIILMNFCVYLWMCTSAVPLEKRENWKSFACQWRGKKRKKKKGGSFLL